MGALNAVAIREGIEKMRSQGCEPELKVPHAVHELPGQLLTARQAAGAQMAHQVLHDFVRCLVAVFAQDQGADDAEELVNIFMRVTDHQKVQRCRAELVLGDEEPQKQHDVAVFSLRHCVVALNDEVPREISGLLHALVEDMLERPTPGF
jgi:hypothetical protein